MRPIAVLRPEPGNAVTVARIRAAGGQAVAMPLFVVQPLAWQAPAASDHDALFLTSANAVRHAGSALADYGALPLFAVGAATANAAADAALHVAAVGTAGAEELARVAATQGITRALHLAGRDRATVTPDIVSRIVEVYESCARPIDRADLGKLAGAVVLLHSPRAAARLSELISDRGPVAIAAISKAALAAAGAGWQHTTVADTPDDAALVAAALALAARPFD